MKDSSPTTLPGPAFTRRPGLLDSLLTEAGRALQVLTSTAHAARPNPAGRMQSIDTEMSPAEQKHAAGLMRVNHVGEICAQALYRGQAAFCRDDETRQVFIDAAAEEVDHLVWCQERLTELNSRPSYLNPFWYAGSFALGALASTGGTERNLGFMAETEAQVEQHLDRHLHDLPAADERSRQIVEQMRVDEIAHRTTAEQKGARALPWVVRSTMRAMSRIMTTTAYRL